MNARSGEHKVHPYELKNGALGSVGANLVFARTRQDEHEVAE